MRADYIKETIICQFQISQFCQKEYTITRSSLRLNKKRNNGKYRCKLCGIFDTHEGSKSHYFKYDQINSSFFENIDNEIKAYLLGVIAGDGTIADNKRVSLVAAKRDIETLTLFQTYLSPQSPIVNKSDNCCFIGITSKQMAADLHRHLNVYTNKKSDKITIPNISKKLIPHFLRGLMDTDGCIANPRAKQPQPRCFYSSTSHQILKQVQNYVNQLDIISAIRGIKLEFWGMNAIQFMDIIYKNHNFCLSRKKEYYDIWKTWIPREGTSIRPTKSKLKRLGIINE